MFLIFHHNLMESDIMVCLSIEKVFICYHCKIVSIHNLSHYPRRLTRFVLCFVFLSYVLFFLSDGSTCSFA